VSVRVWLSFSNFEFRTSNFSSCRFPPNRAKYQIQFIRLAPQNACFISDYGTSGQKNAQPETRFFGLLATDGDAMPEVLGRDGIVRFAVVGTHARPSADKLLNGTCSDRINRHLSSQTDSCHAKLWRPLSKRNPIVRRRRLPKHAICFETGKQRIKRADGYLPEGEFVLVGERRGGGIEGEHWWKFEIRSSKFEDREWMLVSLAFHASNFEFRTSNLILSHGFVEVQQHPGDDGPRGEFVRCGVGGDFRRLGQFGECDFGGLDLAALEAFAAGGEEL